MEVVNEAVYEAVVVMVTVNGPSAGCCDELLADILPSVVCALDVDLRRVLDGVVVDERLVDDESREVLTD